MASSYFDYGNYYVNHNGESKANTKVNTHRYSVNKIRTAENQFNPQDPFTNSKVMLSTNIFVYSNGQILGMIQSFTVNEQRQINKLQAVGWEGVVQSVPSNTRGGTLNVQRIALYDSTLYSALGLNTHAMPQNAIGRKVHDKNNADVANGWDWPSYGYEDATTGPKVSSGLVFRTLKDQRAPLEIMTKTRMRGDEEKYYVVSYVDAWLSSYNKAMGVGNVTIAESATIAYGDVY